MMKRIRIQSPIKLEMQSELANSKHLAETEPVQEPNSHECSAEVKSKLDSLIAQGETLIGKMQKPDFQVEQMGQEVHEWLDITDQDVWRLIPAHAGYIVAEQGNITHDEKLRYQGWNWGLASLRISVDRRLSRLRETRSQTKVTDLEIGHKDVLQHIVIDPRSHLELSIYKGRTGWPVTYPVRILNTAPEGLDIVGYDVTIFWDGRPVQKVIWQAPSRDASNGITISPPYDSQEPLPSIAIQDEFRLEVPVNVGQIANRPAESPVWTAKGNITFRYGSETTTKSFDFNADSYKLSHEHWVELGQGIRGLFG